MKRILVLILVVFMVLCGCVPVGPDPTTIPPAAVPTTAPTEPTTEPTTVPTNPPTEPATYPMYFSGFPLSVLGYESNDTSIHDVYIYPYTEEDIESAMVYLQECVEKARDKESILELEIYWFAFDPIQLYHRMEVYDPLTTRYSQSTREDDYRNTLIIVGRYYGRFDQSLVWYTDTDYNHFHVWLCRESPDAPWEVYSTGTFPVFDDSYYILQPQEIEALDLTDERVLAGYFVSKDAMLTNELPVPYEQDTYILFVVDEETNTVVCREYPAE